MTSPAKTIRISRPQHRARLVWFAIAVDVGVFATLTLALMCCGKGESGAGPASRAIAKAEWIFSKPAMVEFTKNEITVSQYLACVRAGVCTTASTGSYCNAEKAGRGDHPINCISWYQAEDVCKWLGGRLPTSDEWDKEASNGGTREWPWGASPEVSCEVAVSSKRIANWRFKSEVDGCGRNSTWPVCSKPRGLSVSGLCDMRGNVSEWTATDDTEPRYPPGKRKIIRGDCWRSDIPLANSRSLQVGFRMGDEACYIGARCVRGLGESQLGKVVEGRGATGS
ncbi:MAG: SUMF1/EgtB/PvdO family nonheme iron enzyme [Deltaproteobacteria bacterium]|nr:SUMF1/EgtB/PvdO family nonheme iron enzyme [Deltaproteobacteria bacterium]